MQPHSSAKAASQQRDEFFKRLVWQKDRMLLDDLVFRLQHYREDSTWDAGDQCFVYFKIKGLVDSYARFLRSKPDFVPQNVFEIGLWEGGSIPFWFELFQPAKHVGIDISDRENSAYFKKYIQERGLEQRIQTYWRTDQSDRNRLLEIVKNEFENHLDLVIDDASHYYSLTRASFETLFPLLRPGGLYIIEDWAWEHWPGHTEPAWPKAERLGKLVHELTGIAGSSQDIVSGLSVYQGFVVVERGEKPADQLSSFNLENLIYRQPEVTATEPDLADCISALEQDRAELLEYVCKVEQDRQLKLEENERIIHQLQKLENSYSVRLSNQLTRLVARLRPKR